MSLVKLDNIIKGVLVVFLLSIGGVYCNGPLSLKDLCYKAIGEKFELVESLYEENKEGFVIPEELRKGFCSFYTEFRRSLSCTEQSLQYLQYSLWVDVIKLLNINNSHVCNQVGKTQDVATLVSMFTKNCDIMGSTYEYVCCIRPILIILLKNLKCDSLLDNENNLLKMCSSIDYTLLSCALGMEDRELVMTLLRSGASVNKKILFPRNTEEPLKSRKQLLKKCLKKIGDNGKKSKAGKCVIS